MSKLILNQLRPLKSLFKSKGLDCEQYGIVQDGMLYFNNGFIAVKTPIDLPFDCAVHLHQLYTVLQAIKVESVIIYQNTILTVTADDVVYKIDSIPLELMANTDIISYDPQVDCQSPQIFNSMMKIGEDFVLQVNDEQNIWHGFETLAIINNLACCSDKKNIIQAQLDFGMPNCAFDLPTIIYYNKVAKEIVGMGFQDNKLIIKFDNELVVYLTNRLLNDSSIHWYNKINDVLNEKWLLPDIVLPNYVKQQIAILNKLNSSNVVFFNATFCKAGNDKIEYPTFTQELFNAKLLNKPIKLLLNYAMRIKSQDKVGVSFISENNLIRGFVGMVQDEI